MMFDITRTAVTELIAAYGSDKVSERTLGRALMGVATAEALLIAANAAILPAGPRVKTITATATPATPAAPAAPAAKALPAAKKPPAKKPAAGKKDNTADTAKPAKKPAAAAAK